MKRLDFPLILDILFIFAAFFFLSFTVLRYYINSVTLSFWLGLLVAALSALIGFKLISPRHKNASLKAGDFDKKNEVFFNLALADEKTVQDYFLSLFEKKGIPAQKQSGGIYLTEKETLAVFMFKLTAFNADDLARVIKNSNGKKTAIFTDTANGEALSFAKKTGLQLIDSDSIFALMKDCEHYPECAYKLKTKEKIQIVNFNIQLTRKKAKRFLLFGGMLLLFSMLVAFPIYYLVAGNILIIISLFLKFYGKKPETPDKLI